MEKEEKIDAGNTPEGKESKSSILSQLRAGFASIMRSITGTNEKPVEVFTAKLLEDLDENRIKKDYFDAKRYIGFLLAETFIEKCRKNELGEDKSGT